MSGINEHLRGPWLAVLADCDGFVYPTFDEARKYCSEGHEMRIVIVRDTAMPLDADEPENTRLPGGYQAGDLILEVGAYLIDKDNESLGAAAKYAQAQAMADGLNAAAPLGECVADGADRG